MDVWYDLAKTIVGVYVGTFITRVHVKGREHLPKGAKIIVANHALATDGFLLPFVIPEKVHYLVQEELFRLPILGKIIALADQIPVTAGKGAEAVEIAKQKLINGKTIALFPEGKLNDGKTLLRAYSGAARLALETGAPIVPMGFVTPPQYARPIRARMFGRSTYGSWQFGGPTFIMIGQSWQPEIDELILKTNDYAKNARQMTDELMARIALLVEQTRAYAAQWFPSLASGA